VFESFSEILNKFLEVQTDFVKYKVRHVENNHPQKLQNSGIPPIARMGAGPHTSQWIKLKVTEEMKSLLWNVKALYFLLGNYPDPAEWVKFYINQAQQQTTETWSTRLVNGKAQWVHDNILPRSSHPESIKFWVPEYYVVHPTI
jgi:hypothetical protein